MQALKNFHVLFAVQLLLQFGGNISTVDKEGLTPTMWACHFDQLHNFQMLQQALSRIDPQEDAIFTDTDCNGQSIIHWAVKGAGTLECLEVYLKDGYPNIFVSKVSNLLKKDW